MAYCKDCGQQVGADDKFCKSCGSGLSGSVSEHKEPEGPYTAELVTYPCAYCDGSGEVDVGEIVQVYEMCPVCEGACKIVVPGDYVKCQPCDGTGKEDVGEIITVLEPCGRCRGTGWDSPPPVCGRRLVGPGQ